MEKKGSVQGFVPSSALIAEKIVGFHIGKDMCKYYQVQIAPVWERAANLVGCEKLIERFFNQNGLTTINESCVMDEAASDGDKRAEDNAIQEIDIFDVGNNDDVNTGKSNHNENPTVMILGSSTIDTSHRDMEDACLDSDSNRGRNDIYFKKCSAEFVNRSIDEDFCEPIPTMSANIQFDKNDENAELIRNCLPSIPDSSLDPRQSLNDFPLTQASSGDEDFAPYIKQEVRTAGIETKEIRKQVPHMKRTKLLDTSTSDCMVKNTLKLHDDNTFVKRQAVSTSLLKFHPKKHSSDQPLKCNECNKTFSRNFDLKRHEYYHNRKSIYECNVCNRRYKFQQQLKIHIRTHTGERPYKCHLCEKSFYCNGILQRHMQTHTMERPFKCTQCDKSFKLKGNLQRHEKQH